MSTTTNTTFLLVSILGKQTQIVKEGSIGLIQSTKKKHEKEPQWKNYKFQVRTPEGYKHIRILANKLDKK